MNQTIIKQAATLIAITLLTISFSIAPAYGQTDILNLVGNLVYTKPYADGSMEYIRLSAETDNRVVVNASQCASLSPNGRYVALLDESRQRLTIYDLTAEAMPIETNWSSDWRPCQFSWNGTRQLVFVSDSNTVTALSPQTGDVLPVEVNGIVNAPSLLPYQLSGERSLMSPNAQWALYNQCYATTTQGYCTGNQQMVIYDLANQQVLQTLTDTFATILTETVFPPTIIAANWSPSGRYLLYFTTGASSVTPFQIFDTQARQFINPQGLGNFVVDSLLSGFRWSADETLVGFWGRAGIASPNREAQFASLALSTGQTSISNHIYRRNAFDNWRWSPDNQSIAFVTVEGTLTQYSIGSDETAILDQGVALIYSWTD